MQWNNTDVATYFEPWMSYMPLSPPPFGIMALASISGPDGLSNRNNNYRFSLRWCRANISAYDNLQGTHRNFTCNAVYLCMQACVIQSMHHTTGLGVPKTEFAQYQRDQMKRAPPFANLLGMNMTDFNACMNCSSELGQCTRVAQSSPYNQMSPWMENTLAKAVSLTGNSTCEFLWNDVLSGFPAQFVACSFSPEFNSTLNVKVTKFYVQRLFLCCNGKQHAY